MKMALQEASNNLEDYKAEAISLRIKEMSAKYLESLLEKERIIASA